jgi:hypothetical protein
MVVGLPAVAMNFELNVGGVSPMKVDERGRVGTGRPRSGEWWSPRIR